MMPLPSSPHDSLARAVVKEGEKFQEYYLWLERAMPAIFFKEVSPDSLMLISHSLIGFELQDYFSTINLKSAAIVLCLDSPEADLRILQHYALYGVKNYQAYVSKIPAPFAGVTAPLRIVTIDFTEGVEHVERKYPDKQKEKLRLLVQKHNREIDDAEFDKLFTKLNTRFLYALPIDILTLAIDRLYLAQTRDNCQYEVQRNLDWETKEIASMNIVLAWRNTPKYNFLYSLVRVIHRHGLVMKRVNATYTDPYSKNSVLVMALELHGQDGKAVWDTANISDFLRELVTVKYFYAPDAIDEQLVNKGIISGNMGNLLRAMADFIHQALVHLDTNLYRYENIEEALYRHPDLTIQLCECFNLKFDPEKHNTEAFIAARDHLLDDLNKLDSGQEENDRRRKNVLLQGLNFINHTLKTNFYRLNYTALSFRLDPLYLDEIPFDRSKKFPELPYAIFFIKGMHFFSFHIRFKDLARGGLRTVYPEQFEHMVAERNNVFTECYNLAWTQQKKNKDIPEGGAKGVIFLKPFDRIDSESQILKKELEWSKTEPQIIEQRILAFRREQKVEFLYQAQRSFIESLITIVNCDPDGKIRAKHIVDYWQRPEYIYLGPDENMHDFMIEWIANFSKKYHYKPGSAFISSKPLIGINHKEYGVTSLGVNVYMHQILEYIGINPFQDPFTVKMSGGPDGDVAGNQILNLYHFYPHTAKVIALTDGTGTVNDASGLDLSILKDLFYEGKGINAYPPEKLSEGGFLVDKSSKRHPSAYIQETLCWRKTDGKVLEDWLSGSDMNHLLRFNVHQTKADIFIPAGGRPRTLNENSVKEFLDKTGKPTAKAIIEGANLYLNPKARHFLEERGVLIVKDSSANKGGVICSSFEVLCGLALDEDTFIKHKDTLVQEILERLKLCASLEGRLLIETHRQKGEFLTTISDQISEKINQYTYQILDYLDPIPLDSNPDNPMIRCFLNYCLPTLREHFSEALLREIPDHHKKAIIACHLAAHSVYTKGVDWSPSIVDILPLILANTV